MTILSGQIKLLKSAVLLDTPEGGGAITGTEVVSGLSNNLFPDISELDRTYGNVRLRKAFPAVQTDNVDSYYGSNVIVSKGPEDPNVSALLFTTEDWFDERADAKDFLESYLAKGIKWLGQLLEVQIEGARSFQILNKPGDPLPNVGQSMVLIQDEGKPTQFEQFVRISEVSTETREFEIQGRRWIGQIITCETTDALRYTFEGPEPSPFDDQTAKAIVRDTIVANAAKYFGISNLEVAAELGQFNCTVDTIFGQLVPSSQGEVPLTDLNVASDASPMVAISSTALVDTITVSIGTAAPLYLKSPIIPGSLQLVVASGTITDSSGKLFLASSEVGTIDYASGYLYFSSGTYTGTKTATFKAAVVPLRYANTATIYINSVAERGYVYAITLRPYPKPGATRVAYRAQGVWYELRDIGPLASSPNTGILKGADSALGSGTVNYTTGTVTVTLGAYPDVYSDVLFFWATTPNFFDRSAFELQKPYVTIQLENEGIAPSSLTVEWPDPDGAGTCSVTDDGHGNLTGDGTGTIRYTEGLIKLTTTKLPLSGTTFSSSYQYGPKLSETFPNPAIGMGGNVVLSLPDTDIIPGSVEVDWNVEIEVPDSLAEVPAFMAVYPHTAPQTAHAKDTGVVVSGSGLIYSGTYADPSYIGSITYATGEFQFTPDYATVVPVPQYESGFLGYTCSRVTPNERVAYFTNRYVGNAYVAAGAVPPTDGSFFVTVRYRKTDSETSVVDEEYILEELLIDVTPAFREVVVSGSLVFTLGGKRYYDRLGTLVTDVNPLTDAGVVAGTVSYGSGVCHVTYWAPNATNTIALNGMLTEIGGQVVDSAVFRIPTAPVRPGSVQILFSPVTGGTVDVTADSSGIIEGDGIFGTVNYQTGVVRVQFGDMVTAVGNEDEIWYDADAIDAEGKIFKPAMALADTIRYNAIGVTYLPLDADILGLDTVRLPADGRVPIFAPAYVAVVHHTAETAFPGTPTVGSTLDVGRVRLSYLKVKGTNGVYLDPAMYETDLDAGTVELITGYTLGSLTLPLLAEHRIEDSVLVTDAQITGLLTFSRALTHDFPEGSYVSSALIMGDLQARIFNVFSQTSWTGVWSDTLIGTEPIGQFNHNLYPITTTNLGSLQERWAFIFTTTTTFRIVGEGSGQIGTGSIDADCEPVNPRTGEPYFSINHLGWGGGWAAGNVVRMNSAGANYPVWIARSVLQGPETVDSDYFQLDIRGDRNT